ncbi:MAG: alpha/beta fold hydrolase [Alphaproteobacteria bacterium]
MREATVRTADGLDLLAWYAPRTVSDAHVLVYFHGNAGTLNERADKLRPYLEAGLGVLAVSWRGFGGNPGRPTEEGLYRDADAAIELLGAMGHPPQDLVLYGESLGTAVATRCAVEYPVAALVLEAPPLSIVKMGQWRYPWLPVGPLTKDRFETDRRIQQVRCPILIMHGRNDGVVPFEMGQTLARLANGRAVFRPFDEAHHTNLHEYGSDRHVLDFLAELGLATAP